MILNLLFQNPLLFVAWVAAILMALTFHEFAHALAAKLLGDDTAERAGRLTLNPIPHIDPTGFILLLIAGFGWAKPVPYNPYNLRNQRWGSAVVGLAGPFSNLLIVLVSALILRFLAGNFDFGPNNLLIFFLLMLIQLNIVLLVFNLLPIPPLDGSKVLFSLLPDKYINFKIWLEQKGPFLLFFLIIVDTLLPTSIFASFFALVYNYLILFLL